MLIITGPNMGGKSTYMRQTALIALMAYIGSYVPAQKVEIGPIDRIFTRVGAADDLASGRSTFMVEMTETANILHNATEYSLVLMDEIGRGTSTYDGLSLAWACAENLANKIKALTLFATHYFELTQLPEKMEGVANVHLDALEHGDTIAFMHSVQDGAASKSYGLAVAALAGVPKEVIKRARQKLRELESISPNRRRYASGWYANVFAVRTRRNFACGRGTGKPGPGFTDSASGAGVDLSLEESGVITTPDSLLLSGILTTTDESNKNTLYNRKAYFTGSNHAIYTLSKNQCPSLSPYMGRW